MPPKNMLDRGEGVPICLRFDLFSRFFHDGHFEIPESVDIAPHGTQPYGE